MSASGAHGGATHRASIHLIALLLHSSRMVQGEGGRRLLRQDAVARAFLVRRHLRVLLEIQGDPGRRIDLHDVLGRDFRRYGGAWRVSGTPVETKGV